MKKKILLFLLTINFVLTGCQLSNNPTSKVEELLGKYQKLDNSITISYSSLSNSENISNEQKEKYNDLIKEQYMDLSYEIKDEKIDGDTATVTVQIEVKDYKNVIDKYDISNYETSEYHDLVISDLVNVKDKVTYTIDFIVNKINDEWTVEDLNSEQQKKLLGIY